MRDKFIFSLLQNVQYHPRSLLCSLTLYHCSFQELRSVVGLSVIGFQQECKWLKWEVARIATWRAKSVNTVFYDTLLPKHATLYQETSRTARLNPNRKKALLRTWYRNYDS